MEEVSVQKTQRRNQFKSGSLFSKSKSEAFCLKLRYLLEVKINDDIVEELSTVKALQVLHCDSYSSFQRRRRKLNQPKQRRTKERYESNHLQVEVDLNCYKFKQIWHWHSH